MEIPSVATGDNYLIRIHLPPSFDLSKDYPVLYQLDGETTTGSVIKSYLDLQERDVINEIIIITIDYKHENNRERDFTPTAHSSFDESGGASNFLLFLTDELVPLINARYPVDQTFGNTLRGHSLGGLFASYALFEDNQNHFQNFIIESPSWWWDDNFAIGQEYQYAQDNGDLPVRAYFAVGEYEGATMKGSFEVIKDRLESRDYENFESNFEILPKQDHLEVRENSRGLKTIFNK